MKFSFLKNDAGLLYSPELNRLCKNEGYYLEGVESTFVTAKGPELVEMITYPMPHVVDRLGTPFYLAEFWVTLNSRAQVMVVAAVYDQKTRLPKIGRRIDH